VRPRLPSRGSQDMQSTQHDLTKRRKALRAVVTEAYGVPAVVREIPDPKPGLGELLVRVCVLMLLQTVKHRAGPGGQRAVRNTSRQVTPQVADDLPRRERSSWVRSSALARVPRIVTQAATMAICDARSSA
jgi:hypothetical protein